MTTTSESKGSQESLLPNEWETEDYRMAQTRLEAVARYLNLDDSILEPLKYPKRSLSVVVPARMDDGSVRVFAGYRVHHDLALGPGKGGIQYHPEVTLGQVAAMAMLMTWKNSLMHLPFGGAHGGIRLNPKEMSAGELERVTRRFASEIISFIGPNQDIAGPDVNTNEQTMAWMMDTYSVNVGHTVPSVVTGKPRSIGGSLGTHETSGYGAALCANRSLAQLGLSNKHPTVAIQGFGRVGKSFASNLAKSGCRIVAVADIDGGVYNAKGMDASQLIEHFKNNGSLVGFKDGDKISISELLESKCDVLSLCAVSNQINKDNAHKVNCKILVEGCNAPTTIDADAVLDSRGIVVIPDILANAAGVTVGYFEWVQGLTRFIWGESEVYTRLNELVSKRCEQVSARAAQEKISLRLAALSIAVERVIEARRLRGLYP